MILAFILFVLFVIILAFCLVDTTIFKSPNKDRKTERLLQFMAGAVVVVGIFLLGGFLP